MFLPGSLLAIQGDVDLSIVQDHKLWVSQKILANLVVKTDAFTITDLRVDTRSGDDLIIVKPQSAAFKQSETIDGVQWQSTVYEYSLYPMRAGDINLKSFEVSFSASMGYGQPKQLFSLETRPVSLQVNKPEGVDDNTFVLTTQRLELDVSYTPEVDKLTVGDAFEREISVSAENVPDILLQPVPPYRPKNDFEPAAFKVYRSEPLLSETKNTENAGIGHTLARRIEKDTFVASQEGETVIPEVIMYWWDPQQQKLHKEHIPAKSFTIVANPLVSDNTLTEDLQSHTGSPEIKKLTYWILLLAIVFIVTTWWWLPKIKHYMVSRKKQFEASEPGLFNQFEKACDQGKVKGIYQRFYAWARLALPDVSPMSFKQISRQYPQLKAELDFLERSLVKDNEQFNCHLFKENVAMIRKTIITRGDHSEYKLAESINPG